MAEDAQLSSFQTVRRLREGQACQQRLLVRLTTAAVLLHALLEARDG